MKLNHAIIAAVSAMATFTIAAPNIAHADEAAIAEAPKPTVKARKGYTIYSAGERLAEVYRVRKNGDAQVVINGKSRIVPATSFYVDQGRLATTMSRDAVLDSKG